jgi:pre-mRNA-splicing factor ATP-dependent RNA helicase DHX15/PRP43
LDSLVLFLLKIGVKDLVKFDYVDDPAPETLMRALSILNQLPALDDDGNLTPLGGLMAEFPLDHPQLTKTLIVSPHFKCSNEILSIVAMISVGDVWLQLHNQTEEANVARAKFTHPEGDHLALLEIYNQYVLNQHDRNWASRNYLSSCALREADNIRAQLRLIMECFDIDIISSPQKKLSVNIRQALVCGFFMQAAHKERINYCTVEDGQVNSYFHAYCP